MVLYLLTQQRSSQQCYHNSCHISVSVYSYILQFIDHNSIKDIDIEVIDKTRQMMMLFFYVPL